MEEDYLSFDNPNVQENLEEMITDRGFLWNEREQKMLDDKKSKVSMFENSKLWLIPYSKNPGNFMMLIDIISEDKGIKKELLTASTTIIMISYESLRLTMNKNETISQIIITAYKGGSPIRILDEAFTIPYYIFSYRSLSYNVTKHALNPTFKKLPKQLIPLLMENLSLPNNEEGLDKLPTMSVRDPIAKWYGYHLNDIIVVYNYFPRPSTSFVVIQNIFWEERKARKK